MTNDDAITRNVTNILTTRRYLLFPRPIYVAIIFDFAK